MRSAEIRARVIASIAGTALSALLWVPGAPAHAAQTLEVRDGDTTIVRISVRDQTRLKSDRGRVIDVIGDVFDAQRNPAGRIVVLKDEGQGEVYLKPVPPLSVRGPDGGLMPGAATSAFGPIKLDVKTDRGTVGLLLQPADVIGDTLTLRVLTPDGSPGAPSRAAAGNAKAGAHVRAAKALLLAMAAPGLAGEIPTQRMPAGGQEVALWAEARFVLLAKHDAGELRGETYSLTNHSGNAMVIDERELYAPGVVAIAVAQHALPVGSSTKVWIVRRAVDVE